MISLSYDKGTILISGDVQTPYGVWDKASRQYRAEAYRYGDIVRYLEKSRVPFEDKVLDLIPCPRLKADVVLRDYQDEALQRWSMAEKKGVVVLPTGSGKTIVGIKAIEQVGGPALIIVPVLDLVDQWKGFLSKAFGIPIGTVIGGVFDLQPITVATYDSAYLRMPEIGNRFALIVCDEVHHLGGLSYAQIAEMSAARYRLGITATIDRDDLRHFEIYRLLGGLVYSKNPGDLSGAYLSEYRLERVFVDLREDEKKEYDALYGKFRKYITSQGISLSSSEGFRRFIMLTSRDSAARDALLARNEALSIALNTSSKMVALDKLLREASPADRIIIFTQHNDLVYKISKRFLIPFITYRTDKAERIEVLERFRKGEYRAIVASKAIDEGIDVPEASLGILVSGSGSRREFVQRLGRLLRKRENKLARLVEIVSRETYEVGSSRKRKEGMMA
jgi:superfamily II DNA or RNA helicase